MPHIMSAPAARFAARWRASRGAGIVDLLVGMVIAGVVAVVTLSILWVGGVIVTKSGEDRDTSNELQNASGLLLRDVNDGRRILVADADALTVEVIRDSVCTQRAWAITDGDLSVTTSTYSTGKCTGGADTDTMSVVQGRQATVAFHYFSALSQDNEMTQPVFRADITRVVWDLTAVPRYEDARTLDLTSGAAFTARAGSDGTGTQVQDATRPVLSVTTPRVGVDAPVLTWTDTSPELTDHFTVYRIANPEGTGSGTQTTWEAVMQLGKSMLTWTDVSLPAGYTAQYTVVATLTDARVGPTSNQVATGLRPATATTTATGQTSGISVSWTRPTGSSEYDLYRDGELYKTWAQMKAAATLTTSKVTWVDATGAGHAHLYSVVAINRWERGATATAGANATSAQTNQVPAGTDDAAKLGASGLTAARVVSATSGAWSSPVAVTGIATANRLPGDVTNPASTWDTTTDISWTAPKWTGDYGTEAAKNVRYLLQRGSTTVRTGLSAVTTTDTGAPRGSTSTYRVTTSTVGAHQLDGAAATKSLLTWPSAPTCTAALGGDGLPGTRAVTVTVSGPSSQTVDARRQRISSGEIRAAASDAWTSLSHSTTYRWRGQAHNDSGWGPFSSECAQTTQVLAVQLTSATSTTWQVNATAAYTNGTSRQWKLWDRLTWTQHGATQGGGSGAWEPLEDGHPFRVEVTNTDGHNQVNAAQDVDTPLLVAPTPERPSCWASGAPQYAPGTISWGYDYTGNTHSTTGGTTYAPSAGTYRCSITATNTVTDPGFNTASASSTGFGSTYIDHRPYQYLGASNPGKDSSACANYQNSGRVTDLLSANSRTGATSYGYVIGGPVSGSYSADGWSYQGGSVSGGDLVCVFYRADIVRDVYSVVVGEWGAVTRWSLNGSGAV